MFTKKFLQYKLQDDFFKESFGGKGTLVWCKLDAETELAKRDAKGQKSHYLWVLSNNLTIVKIVPKESIKISSAVSVRRGNALVAKELQGEEFNKALTLVKQEAKRINAEKARQASVVLTLDAEKSKSKWVRYFYDYRPIPVKLEGKTVRILKQGDRISIRNIDKNVNLIYFDRNIDEKFEIDNTTLAIILTKSKLQKPLLD